MVINDLKQTTSEFQKAGQGWEQAWGQAYHTISYKYFKSNLLVMKWENTWKIISKVYMTWKRK